MSNEKNYHIAIVILVVAIIVLSGGWRSTVIDSRASEAAYRQSYADIKKELRDAKDRVGLLEIRAREAEDTACRLQDRIDELTKTSLGLYDSNGRSQNINSESARILEELRGQIQQIRWGQ